MKLPFTIPVTIPVSWYIVAALTLTSCLTSCGWNGTYKTLVKERAEHVQVVEQFKASQQKANRKAEAKRVELEVKGKINAKKADERYTTLLAEYRTNLLRFKANQSGSGKPNSGGVQSAEGGNRPGGSTQFLTISLEDAGICATNTARLQAVREWALDPPH